MKIGVLALQGAFREHAEALTALGADVALVKRPEQLDSVLWTHAPDQRVAVPEREQSERPLGGEAFPGNPASRALGRDFSHDGLLPIIPYLPRVATMAAIGQHEAQTDHLA